LDVRYLVNIYHEPSDRARYQGVRRELIDQQARCLGLEPYMLPAAPGGFEPAFVEALRHLKAEGITGVIFGNIHLSDVRQWYEERVTREGLHHLEPLWGEPSIELAWEVVERGYLALVVSVKLDMEAVALLGREIDADFVTEVGCSDDIDPSGERGEYHTFVFDGPEFVTPVTFTRGDTLEVDGHRLLDLIPPQH